ncbi:required for meiotic nuclear division protein 1 homolog [Monomorium pharaonis]|uniref:required for meiotic nuclear division protein 1 homolog n=1 Tax=Monomorium pharaonis TaxID=307658 RepID=UPI00102E1714|nr:required for meiotic nuclear division protein 1 homolog [Monomorium pharaonis]XP_028047227.1 required for meiotic nuclear division protein 1 homolog [Monomorium pharaonis]
MNLAIIQRLVLSSCRDKIDIYQRIVPSLNILRGRTVIKAGFSSYKCTVYKRFLHDSTIHSAKINPKENGTDIVDNISTFKIKKTPSRRNRVIINDDKSSKPNTWTVKALATAEEYNLENLAYGLLDQQLYIPSKISTSTNSLPDVIHAVAKYEVGHEPREIFFFREGSIVMWNISNLECGNLLQFLRRYELNRYIEELVHTESELMNYSYADPGKKSHLKDGDIVLAQEAGNLDKYTFSNAMAQSVKLGIWEASLNRYVDSIQFVTEDLRIGKKIQMTQHEVLKKQGELFALRHRINLTSDLLDTPDFYWERDDLENLYQQTCGYFSIAKRTRVMNERLNHCLELVSILSSHLSDRHHVRLEWMIIVLIMVEVAFEVLHYIDRYLVK